MRACGPVTFSSQPRGWWVGLSSQINQNNAPQVARGRNPLLLCLEACLAGDSRSYQIDNTVIGREGGLAGPGVSHLRKVFFRKSSLPGV